ncbi:competence/damage-inducible protein CinA-like protein [Opitutaceae bacterium TAV1]|nr:competence/damage-inducible protein CinA-like protein [Opitutaceae bacterium TAV1]
MNPPSHPHPSSTSEASQPGASPARPVTALRYELLTLGDELLLGLTANSHLTFIGEQLGRRGVLLQRNVTITDEADVIAAQFRESWGRADVVITTGGLGPTCDDRTREAVAAVLGQKLVFEPKIVSAIEERFSRLGRRMTENNLKQAYRFADGEVLPNPNGTAPGLWIEQAGRVLVMLPGPPNELQPMFTDQVVPRLAARGLLAERESYIQLRTAGIGESALEVLLQPVFDRYGDALGVAFCAHLGRVDCRLSSPSGALRPAELDAIAADCARLLGEDFVCYGQDPLAKVVAELLRSQEQLLAVAETATGGALVSAFADFCGRSKFLAGGCVCCSHESKMQLADVPEDILMQHGAASDEGAVAMAVGVAERLGADYGLALTGYGGPCAGQNGSNEYPVGTIHLALCTPHGVWSKKLSYPGERSVVRTRAVTMALDWLRRELLRARRGAVAGCPPRADGVIQ